MACRRLAVAFFAAATCAALLLAASASSSPLPPPPAGAVQRDVGDDAGYWTETVPPAGDATETLSQWAERQRWHVGDVLGKKPLRLSLQPCSESTATNIFFLAFRSLMTDVMRRLQEVEQDGAPPGEPRRLRTVRRRREHHGDGELTVAFRCRRRRHQVRAGPAGNLLLRERRAGALRGGPADGRARRRLPQRRRPAAASKCCVQVQGDIGMAVGGDCRSLRWCSHVVLFVIFFRIHRHGKLSYYKLAEIIEPLSSNVASLVLLSSAGINVLQFLAISLGLSLSDISN